MQGPIPIRHLDTGCTHENDGPDKENLMKTSTRAPALAMALALILGATAAAAPAATGRIDVVYSLLLQNGKDTVATGMLDGLDSGAGFRVRLRPAQECYVYLVAQRGSDDFRLLLPDRRTQRGKNRLARSKDFTWPQEGWLRLDEKSGVERLYLILADRQIPELEARFALREVSFPESVIVEIRDRYQGITTYRRKVTDQRVKVRFKSRGGEAALLIEEIAIRHM